MHFCPPALATLTLLVWFDTGVHFSSKPRSWVNPALDSFGGTGPLCSLMLLDIQPTAPEERSSKWTPNTYTECGHYSLSTNPFPGQMWSNSTELVADIDREDIARPLSVTAPLFFALLLPSQPPPPMFLSPSWTWGNISLDQLKSFSVLSLLLL